MGQHLVRAGVTVSPTSDAIVIPSKLAEMSTLPPQLDLCRRRDGTGSVQHPPQLSRTDPVRTGQSRTESGQPESRDPGDRAPDSRPTGRPAVPLPAVSGGRLSYNLTGTSCQADAASGNRSIWSHVCNSANKHQRKLIERFRKRIRNDSLCNALKAHVRAGYVQRQKTKQEAGARWSRSKLEEAAHR